MIKDKNEKLFLTFLKIGAFTFGGGYAMIPLIQREIVEKNEWLTQNDILDIIAIAETTPGPIAINAATFVGYKVNGKKGAIVSTLGVVLPSFFMITLIAYVLKKYMGLPIVQNAFWGIRIAVLALIVNAFITMAKKCPKNIATYIVAIGAFIGAVFLKINVLFVIISGAVLGILYQFFRKEKKQ